MNNNILLMAQQFIRNNKSNIPNTPWAQSAINAIMNGDEKSGMQIADNLCKSYGMTKEEVIQQILNGNN